MLPSRQGSSQKRISDKRLRRQILRVLAKKPVWLRNTTHRAPWQRSTQPAAWTGAQVVIEDKRQLCVAKVARSMAKPWLWWTFAGEYSRLCTMANG